MEMIYYGGMGKDFTFPKKIDLIKDNVVSFEILLLKGWKSPNLIINFENYKFEQPVPLIVNYGEVLKYLKKHNTFTKNIKK